MPKIAKPLTPLEIRHLRHPEPNSERPALVAVGHVPGLCLQIGPPDANGNSSKSWIYRAIIGEKRRHAGLGGYPATTLAMAVEAARKLRQTVRDGADPIEQRQAAKRALVAAQRRSITFEQAVERFWPEKEAALGSAKSRTRWRSITERYALPKIGKEAIGSISKADIMEVLEQDYRHPRTGAAGPLVIAAPETAEKLRIFIMEVFDWLIDREYLPGPNPARIKMRRIAGGKRKSAGHPSLAPSDVAAWWQALAQHGGMSAQCLKFVALTACRSGEARGCTWSEIDLDSALWEVAADRMKGAREHFVPLSCDAVAMLRQLHSERDLSSNLVFPAQRGGMLSDMALSMLMRDLHVEHLKRDEKGFIDRQSGRPAVVHGLRATFKTWATDIAEYPREMAEIALAHAVGDDTEQAYMRGSMIDKRRQMMNSWAKFICN